MTDPNGAAPGWDAHDATRAAHVRMGDGTFDDVLWYREAIAERDYESLIEAWRHSTDPTERVLAECEDLAWSLRADADVWAEVLGAVAGQVSEYGTQISRSVTDGNLEEARTMAAAILYVCAHVPLADFIVDGLPLRLDADVRRDLREGVQLRQEFRRLLDGFALPRESDIDQPQDRSVESGLAELLRRLLSGRTYRERRDSSGDDTRPERRRRLGF